MIILIAIGIILTIIWEGTMIHVYGRPTLTIIDLSKHVLNDLDHEIINECDDVIRDPYGYIAYLPGFSIFGSYFIEGKGIILRFSKMHRAVKRRFKELKKEHQMNDAPPSKYP